MTATRILGRTVDSIDEAGRRLGKICELSFGYGGTLGAWRRFDTTHSDAAVKRFCADWRRAHKATQFFWRALENGLHDTLRTERPNKLRSLAFTVEDGTLYLTLPSGRRLAYPEARIDAGEHGPQIVFKDNAQGRWKDCRGWFGVFVENVVQAISRDILAAAMQRVEAAGFSITLHVHDELMAEVPGGFGSVEEFERLVTRLPGWATGLPIAAKPWISARYAKVKVVAPAPKPAAPQPPPPTKVSTGFARHDKIHCPFHDDSTPSLQLYTDHYHCFGCGAHGDLVDWLVKVKGMNILAAEKAAATYRPAPPASNGDENKYLPAALRLWKEAQPVTGALAARYLTDIRRIDINALPPEIDLRFHPRCQFNGAPAPCLLVLLRDALTDAPTGIHRIALTPEVFAGGKVERRLLGRQGRGVAKLWPAGSELVVGEGIETVLAAATRIRHHGAPDGAGVTIDDFRAHMPSHSYIFMPCRDIWPATSVNSRLSPMPVLDANEMPKRKRGKDVMIPASQWLDQNRPVEQVTWCPGLPMLIEDRLVVDGGWIERNGVTCFNLYRRPRIKLGDAAKVGPWLAHAHLVFEAQDVDHIMRWLAQRVQNPGEKINHALVMGGAQGIGKDTLLEPVKQAVGPWNFCEVSPTQLLGRFNSFVRSVILRVNEARDLGVVDRFAFYDHTKVFTAAPPDVLRVDEKNLREYYVFNCLGLIHTTNHKTDGLYLPADDRRHYVAWSNCQKEDFPDGYWNDLWGWYAEGGTENVAAYLSELDLSDFDPKAPPPKTAAFWDIVNANQAPEDTELADVIDALGNPDAMTVKQLIAAAIGPAAEWLLDHRSRRALPHRLERCGYVSVNNPDAKDGVWKIKGVRQWVYARARLSLRDQLAAARKLGSQGS